VPDVTYHIDNYLDWALPQRLQVNNIGGDSLIQGSTRPVWRQASSVSVLTNSTGLRPVSLLMEIHDDKHRKMMTDWRRKRA
jgi:hypothetical protein